MRAGSVVLFLLVLWLFPGCGSNPSKWPRVHLTGNVTYEGEPVQDGSITLRPAAGTSGPAAGAAIVGGKYDIPESDGPTLGKYLATVTVVMAGEPRIRVGPREVPPMRRFEHEVEFVETEEQHDFALPPP